VTLGNDNGTDGQTDRQTDRVRRNMRSPPREEGRITTKRQNMKQRHKTTQCKQNRSGPSEHHKTDSKKPRLCRWTNRDWFSRLVRHSARKWIGFILQLDSSRSLHGEYCIRPDYVINGGPIIS